MNYQAHSLPVNRFIQEVKLLSEGGWWAWTQISVLQSNDTLPHTFISTSHR